jgi:hypothetical protein
MREREHGERRAEEGGGDQRPRQYLASLGPRRPPASSLSHERRVSCLVGALAPGSSGRRARRASADAMDPWGSLCECGSLGRPAGNHPRT